MAFWKESSIVEPWPKSYLGTVGFSLFLTTSLLELHATHVHDSGSDLVHVLLLLLGETKDVEGLLQIEKDEENR